MQVFDFWMER